MRVVKKCEICSAPATVFLTQIINGKSTKFCLCAKCAQERGLLDPDAFDLAEKLFPNLQGQFGKEGSFPWQWQERIMNAPPNSAIKSNNCARRPINIHAL